VAQQVAQHIERLRLLESAERYRAEAENAVRRLTREGWQSYMEAKENPTLGYMYDLNEVLPVAPNSEITHHSISLPLTSRNETLGQLAVDGVEADDQEALELVNSIAERLSSHIENLRLLDETEKQRAEAEALVRELDIQKYALDQHSIVAITDVTGKIIYANDKFAEISKYSHDEIIGQDHRMLNSGYHPKEFIRDLWVTIANGKVWHGEVKNRAKDGSLYWVDTTIVPILNEKGKPERYLAIRTDVTQRKNDEIQREKRAEELQSVAEIATKASSVSDVNEMLNVVVESTKSAFELYHSHIYLLDESQTNLVLTAGAGEPGRQMVSEKRTIALDHERSLVARAARTNQGAISNDVTQEPDFLPNPLLPDTKSEMAIPISISDKVLGVLDIQADYVGRFSNEDISIITTLAQQIATSLQNARTFAQAQQQADREARLNIISQKIQSATTVDAVLQIAARELGHTLGAPITIAQLGLVDKSNGDNGNNNS